MSHVKYLSGHTVSAAGDKAGNKTPEKEGQHQQKDTDTVTYQLLA